MHQQYNSTTQSPLALLHWLCKETLRGQKITDVLGNVLIKQQVNNESYNTIDISKLLNGIYIVQAMQKDGIVLTNKLIKQ